MNSFLAESRLREMLILYWEKKMKNILVTGGTGFIGSALIERLSKEHYNITVLTRKKRELEGVRRGRLSKATIIELDLSEISKLLDYDVSFDTCYHFAWNGIAGDDLQNEKIQLENVQYCMDLIRVLAKVGCNKFIGAGSFGQLELSFREPIKGRERYYKCAKAACENFGKIVAKENEVEFIWPLITNSYGVGEQSNRFINTILKKLIQDEDIGVSDGKQLYDFIYIDDLIEAFYLLGENGKSGRHYLIGSGSAKKHRDWIEHIPEMIQSKGKLKFGEFEYDGVYLEKKDFDISELVEDTGFSIQVPFEEGIRRTARYIQENL